MLPFCLFGKPFQIVLVILICISNAHSKGKKLELEFFLFTVLMSLVAHPFGPGRVELLIFVLFFQLPLPVETTINIRNLKFEIGHVQINELPRTLSSRKISATIIVFDKDSYSISYFMN